MNVLSFFIPKLTTWFKGHSVYAFFNLEGIRIFCSRIMGTGKWILFLNVA
jgi:hypothetical protein